MTKMEIVAKVAEQTEMTKTAAEKAVNMTLAAIQDALIDGDKVQIVGFGTFEVKDRSARVGRNPKTGEPIEIPAVKIPSFKAGKPFKDAVNA